MMMRIFDKISKIFFAFICFIVILGMIFLSVRNYTTPIVSCTLVVPSDKLKSTYYFTGTVVPENSKAVEVKAAQDMDISNINIKADQIVPKDENLFTLDYSSSTSDKTDAQDAFNDKLYNTNIELNRMIKSLEKKVNKEIDNIDSVNPYDGITVYATADGKVKNLSIEEGKKVNNNIISNIIDDSMLKISFKMTANEYTNINVGQKVIVTFAGYEGYYEAEVTSINPNAVPDKDKVSFIYNGVIEAKNPGLISTGVNVGVSTQSDGQPVATLTNAGIVESYSEQLPVTTEVYSNSDMEVYATKVYVIEGETVKKGQKIAVLGGEDLVNHLNENIKNIKDKMKLITNIKKDIGDLYGDVITLNSDNKLIMDSYGNCIVSDRIYVDYITEKTTLRKGDIILKYHTYNNDAMSIKAVVDAKTYKNLKQIGDKIYYGANKGKMDVKAALDGVKEFSKSYELSYKYQEADVGRLNLSDNVIFSFIAEEKGTNVIPKTAIVPIGKIEVGSSGFVYIVNTEDSILGNIDVLEEKKVTITAVGDETVSIEFDKNFFTGYRDIFIVNHIDSTLKDGMRVKTR